MFASLFISAQASRDSTGVFKFSGTLTVTTNGISPIPAFSLGQPAVLGLLYISRKRLSYDPQFAFSNKGVPWYFNNIFRYQLIDRSRFTFRVGAIWGIGFAYPRLDQNGSMHSIAKAERYFWLELMPKYKITKHFSINCLTYSGHGFDRGTSDLINFISLMGNITKVPLSPKLYFNFFPQVFYLNIDEKAEGFFVSGVFGIGIFNFPVSISTQMNETISTNLSPDPGFKWNISMHVDL
jgi:hypothetical protein